MNNKGNINEIVEQMRVFCAEHDLNMELIKMALNAHESEQANARLREKVDENKDLVGRCFVKIIKPEMFPEMKRYYKVISARSENEYRVECLVCDEKPTYVFDLIRHKVGVPGDYFLGSFTYEGIHTDSMMASEVRSMEETTAEDFETAVRRYTDQLLSMPWVEEHCRTCNRFPTDEGWGAT